MKKPKALIAQVVQVRVLVRECTDLLDELDSALEACERLLPAPEPSKTTVLAVA